jgi:aryl-alcohol dehydrogenase-like predicted oxidoreductase
MKPGWRKPNGLSISRPFRLPALSLGTATFGGKGAFFAAWGDTQAELATRLVEMCLDFGLNMFDSADIYSAGLAEEILGAAIKGKRDCVIILTKATFRSGDGPNDVGSSRYHLINACEKALKRLGTDHIDIFQRQRSFAAMETSKISSREIFGVVGFSTFSTISAGSGTFLTCRF